MKRVMWIAAKSTGLAGPARLGRVQIGNRGKKLVYEDRTFLSLRGRGFEANDYDAETSEQYRISGRRRDGRDALYDTDVEIDDDALEE